MPAEAGIQSVKQFLFLLQQSEVTLRVILSTGFRRAPE